jgi:hypothetical protein
VRKVLVFGLSALFITAVLFLTACGGGSGNTSAVTSTSIQTASSSSSVTSQTSPTGGVPGKPTNLKFITQPAGGKAGQPLSTQPVVGLVDASGTLVPNYIGSVNILVASGDGSLSGSNTMIYINGLATFSDLSLSAPGTYTLKAITREVQSTISDPFTVAP